VSARRESLNATAKLSMGTPRDGMNFSTDLIPTMASQAASASRGGVQSFELQSQEAWLLRSVAAPTASIEPFVATARLRLTDPSSFNPVMPVTAAMNGTFDGTFDDRWNGLLQDQPLPSWYTTPKRPKGKGPNRQESGTR
jgi:hypothetical protein